jgi:hypothetical protein
LSALAGYGLLPPAKTKDKAMIKDAQSQGDLIAALHLEVLFDSGHFGNIGDKNNLVTYAAPSIHCPNEYDVGHLRHRLVFIRKLAVSTDMTKTGSVVGTIKDGWHRST